MGRLKKVEKLEKQMLNQILFAFLHLFFVKKQRSLLSTDSSLCIITNFLIVAFM